MLLVFVEQRQLHHVYYKCSWAVRITQIPGGGQICPSIANDLKMVGKQTIKCCYNFVNVKIGILKVGDVDNTPFFYPFLLVFRDSTVIQCSSAVVHLDQKVAADLCSL